MVAGPDPNGSSVQNCPAVAECEEHENSCPQATSSSSTGNCPATKDAEGTASVDEHDAGPSHAPNGSSAGNYGAGEEMEMSACVEGNVLSHMLADGYPSGEEAECAPVYTDRTQMECHVVVNAMSGQVVYDGPVLVRQVSVTQFKQTLATVVGEHPMCFSLLVGERELLDAELLSSCASSGTPGNAILLQLILSAERAPAVRILQNLNYELDGNDYKGYRDEDLADIHGWRNPIGETSRLMCAARLNHQLEVLALLRLDADVDYQSRNGSIALHTAASRGFCNITKMLLAFGSLGDVRNLRGMTPLGLATSKGHVELATLLRIATPESFDPDSFTYTD